MPIQKQTANQVLSGLDRTATRLEGLVKAGKIDPKLAASLITEIDAFADKFQVAAFGPAKFKAFQAKVAKVIKRDSDEGFMDTFENPNKVIQSYADEPYMHKTPASFNADAIDNYDADRTSTVTDRKEHNVRDISEHADGTKKQPSWAKGPAGKSTRQGSTRVRKTWAE
jgi:hypothetical protein